MIKFGPQSQLSPLLTSEASSSSPLPVSSPSDGNISNLRYERRGSDYVIRHLPNAVQGYRLVGENDTLEWPLYLSSQQVTGAQKLRVGYMSAVSVMPEASVLTISINDQQIGTVNIRAAGNVRTIEFDVPKDLLVAGFNALRISVDQRHRVDCSLEATYELWTQIEPTQTGLLIARDMAAVNTIDDVAALLPDSQGALPVRLVLPMHTSPATLERHLRAVQLLALKGRFEQTVTDVGALADGDFGINLVVGTRSDISTIDGLAPLISDATSGLLILPRQTGRRTTLIVTGSTEDDVNRAFNTLIHVNEAKGHIVGLRAAQAYPGYRVDPPQRVMLKDMGLVSQEFTGRFYRAGFNIMMPADFYPADYARAQIAIDGAYAQDLLPEAQIMVTSNGKNASSLMLPKSSGDILHKSEIQLGLGALRPGLNRIEIQALVPHRDDKSCDLSRFINADKRFLFLNSSEIILPQIAHIARLPDLSVTASGAFPYANSHLQSLLYLPVPDRYSIAAAATLAARMAVSAGQLIDFRLVTKMPPAGSGALLVVGSYAAAKSVIIDDEKEVIKNLDDVWRDRGHLPDDNDERLTRYEEIARNRLVLQKNFPAACHLPKPAKGFIPAAQFEARSNINVGNHDASELLYNQWQQNLHKNSLLYLVEQIASSLKDSAINATRIAQDQIQYFINEHSAHEDVSFEHTSLVVIQALKGNSQDDVVTTVLAPNPRDLNDSVACLVDPRVWRQLDGRMALLDASEGHLNIAPAVDQRLVSTQPFSVTNMRLVAASWLTSHKLFYVSLALLIAILLGCSTHWFVTHVGRRNI